MSVKSQFSSQVLLNPFTEEFVVTECKLDGCIHHARLLFNIYKFSDISFGFDVADLSGSDSLWIWMSQHYNSGTTEVNVLLLNCCLLADRGAFSITGGTSMRIAWALLSKWLEKRAKQRWNQRENMKRLYVLL